VIAVLVSLLPVLAFLLVLLLVDSFKLVGSSLLAKALGAGAVAAGLGMLLHGWLVPLTGLGPATVARYVTPVTEEALKATFVIYTLRRGQIGFLVDAAILGFAIGAGFAVVENIDYLWSLANRQIWVWIVRGFGTAVLHAATTAVVAMVAKSLLDKAPGRGWLVIVPGWIAAVVMHSAYNHALISPVLAASLLLIAMPLVVMAVFSRSERMTREWVGDGLDLDVELLQLVKTPHFGATRLGRYLQELKSRFPGPVVADMFCLLQLELELSIRAKGMLMAREAGLDVPVDEGLRAQLAERAYLERSIGPTGLLALRPLQVTSERDQWHKYLLTQAGSPRRRWPWARSS
jgi:RsiW-degrading membrane proteinase PrsW (M82 family)